MPSPNHKGWRTSGGSHGNDTDSGGASLAGPQPYEGDNREFRRCVAGSLRVRVGTERHRPPESRGGIPASSGAGGGQVDVAVLNSNTLDGHGHDRTEQLLSFVNTYAADHDAILTNPDILQAVIQDMYIGSDPMRFFNWFDAIVYDEFHFYEALSASGLLLQIKILSERQPDAKILLASATPNEEFVDFLRDRIGLRIRDIDADYDWDGDQFRHRMVVSRHEDRKMIDCRDEIAAELQEKIDAINGYDEPQIVLVFNSAKDSPG